MNTRLVIFLTFFVLILISGCASIELEAVRADARALERQSAHLWSRRHELVKDIKEIQDWLQQPSASVQERAAQQVEI